MILSRRLSISGASLAAQGEPKVKSCMIII
jgi:hypothetical protein